ncbi:DUF4157 domain-containing protein [Nostoc sp. C117]|uniref:eCIS core domain-containing protein n=1 Tax=Nostoc sp. C117 TaxID=3349875 RepID=UPI00370DB5C9
MKERIVQPKKVSTDSFSISVLRKATLGFGSQSSGASSPATPNNKSLVHDISRIPLHRPQTKLTVNQPGDIYEQEADTVAKEVMVRLGQPLNYQSIQRQEMPEEEEWQMKPLASSITPVVQREEIAESESEELQMSSLVQHQAKGGMAAIPDLEASINQAKGGGEAHRPNQTGLSDNLKAGIESLSGIAMDDVKVHYNSAKPAKIQALAYTQGKDIYVASGQEKHLPHEAWHVVQQKQGRVEPSIQMKGIYANVDLMLEKEADIMGEKANNLSSVESRLPSTSQSAHSSELLGQPLQNRTIQGAPVRQFICGSIGSNPPTLDALINTSAKASPSTIANQLADSSPAFAKLRGTADTEVNNTFGKEGGVEYKDKPKKGGGTSAAYYKDGVTYFDREAPMPTTVLNIVFETANAAQAGIFQKIESDYDKGILLDTPMKSYIEDPSLLGKYQNDYDPKNAASKRSLIQEYYEWNSCLIAQNALRDLSQRYTSEVASITWISSFGLILECRNFEEYYELQGKIHRRAVQGTLEQPKTKQDSGNKIDVSNLF